MENNTHHIDHFLHLKLGSFEALPDETAWTRITGDLSHLSHPADSAINQHLSDLEKKPGAEQKKTILTNEAIYLHPIDTALYEKLSMLESMPEKHAFHTVRAGMRAGERKRKRIFAWILGGIILLSEVGITYQSLNERRKTNMQSLHTHETSRNKENSQKPHLKDALTPERGKQSNTEISRKNIERIPDKSGRVDLVMFDRTDNPADSYYFDTILPDRTNTVKLIDGETSDMIIYKGPGSIRMSGLSMFKHTYNEHTEKLVSRRHPYMPKKKLSPFSINFQVGYINERRLSSFQKNDNVHKDALSAYNKASGHSRNGEVLSLNLGYRLKSGFILKTGLQYTMVTETSNFSYVYSAIPFYDSLGNLVRYVVRPVNQSPHVNENVKNTSTSLSVPVQVFGKIFEIPRMSIWAGTGCDLVVQREQKGRLFSFEDGGVLKDFGASSTGLSPHISLLTEYYMRPGLSLTANMQFSYIRDKSVFERASFVKQQLAPHIKFGILYTPILTIK